MSDKNICMRLDGCWTMPWRKLSSDQKQAWLEALGQVGGGKGKDGRSWSSRTVQARQSMAASEDARRDQERELERKREQERSIGWWDATLDAHHWFAMKAMTPREAAMVLCGLNPLSPDDQDPEHTHTEGDGSWPRKFGLLLRVFEEEARASNEHRTLMDWRIIAKERGLPYHEWIEKYREARGFSEQLATGIGNKTGPISGSPSLQYGKNSRPAVKAWIQYQANEMVRDDATAASLAEQIKQVADKFGFESERGPLTIASILRMLPTGVTGGRGKRSRKTRK